MTLSCGGFFVLCIHEFFFKKKKLVMHVYTMFTAWILALPCAQSVVKTDYTRARD